MEVIQKTDIEQSKQLLAMARELGLGECDAGKD